jgi:hypothetical protein
MDLGEELRALTVRYWDDLGAVPWASEVDRWNELVFCVLGGLLDRDPAGCRELTTKLADLGLLEPPVLARAGDPASEEHTALRYLLVRQGLVEAEVERAVGALARIAGVVIDRYGGKFQRYLRAKAEAMRDELVAMFADSAGAEPELPGVVAHWLQNAMGMPLSLEDASVQAFCEAHGISGEELEHAADEIDFNIALVDDVLRLDAAARGEGASTP